MNEEYEDEINFLMGKGMIKEGNKCFIISGDFGNIDLVELLNEYALWYESEHDQGAWGQKPLD